MIVVSGSTTNCFLHSTSTVEILVGEAGASVQRCECDAIAIMTTMTTNNDAFVILT
jgi:hypothetical protein